MSSCCLLKCFRIPGEEQGHLQCRPPAADPHLLQQLPQAAVCWRHRNGLRNQEEGPYTVHTVQEITGLAHEDPQQLPTFLHQMHQAQWIQEANGEASTLCSRWWKKQYALWLTLIAREKCLLDQATAWRAGDPGFKSCLSLEILMSEWVLIEGRYWVVLVCHRCLTEDSAVVSFATLAWWRPSESGVQATPSGTASRSLWSDTDSSFLVFLPHTRYAVPFSRILKWN